MLSRLSRRARIVIAAAAAGGVALVGVAVPALATSPPPAAERAVPSQQQAAGSLTPDEMLRRAATWLTADNGSQVPYSQTQTWNGYRQDCSGYVSMTLGLSKPGPNTVGLAGNRDLTTPISLGELRPGDLLIDADGSNTTRHVVIFEGWTDSSHTAYSAFEQRGGHGTDHRVLDYGLQAGSEYRPYRPVALSGGGGSDPEPPKTDWPVLKQGASGADVTTAQYLLGVRGHGTAADGDYGPRTAAQVEAFQAEAGLAADGVLGPVTWPELIVDVQRGSDGDAVRAVQTQLNAHGHQLAVDGAFGPRTERAVTDFQRGHGLVVDGLVGPQTWQALVGG